MARRCPRPITAGRWCRRFWSRATNSPWCGRARLTSRCSRWNRCPNGWSRVRKGVSGEALWSGATSRARGRLPRYSESDNLKDDLTGYARKITRARLVLGWESGWRLAWPVPAWIALFSGIVLLDLLPRLPSWLHGTLLGTFAIGLFLLAARLRHFRVPSRQDAQRRLETDSNLPHRPLSQLDDRPAGSANDPMAEGLWHLQRQRGLALLARLRLAPPAPGLPGRDPFGLRFAALLVLAVGLAVGRHDPGERLFRALDPGIDANAPPPILQLWVTPPPYTGLQPIMLQADYRGAPIRVPTGSKLLAELQGLDRDAKLGVDGERLPFTRLDAQSQKLETELTHGREVSVRAGWRSLGHWPIVVIPDHPPAVAFVDPPAARTDGKLQLRIAARDDYAVEELGLILTRLDAGGGEAEIRLPGGGQKEILLDQPLDLSSHPWSGLKVGVRPVARDGAGQSGVGDMVEMVLPERIFRHPVARAVAEIRHQLIADPTARLPVTQAIVGIANRPDSWGGDLTVFLELATARARLMQDQSDTAIPSVIDMLWAAAIRIEQGDLQDARDAVDQAAQALQDALTNGASDAEITRLTQELNAAVNRLVQSLAKQAGNNPASQQQSGGQGRALTPEQLQAMLNQMSDLAHSGARDAARQSLDALRNLLSQLSAGGGMSQGAQRLGQSLQSLQGMSDKQRTLLDRAFRRAQQQPGGGDAKSDQQAEDALRQELEQMLEANPEAAEAAPALDQAMRAMNRAGQALQQGQDQAAQTAEGRALDQLQEGARQIGKALEEAGQGAGGENGSDPLGRNLQGKGVDGNGVKIPSQSDIGKAREILDDLRRRAGDADRPPAERDYLRRLLDKIY